MKIGGVKVTGPAEQLLVIPRDEGPLVFRARALPDMNEFEALCPVPQPPGSLTKDGWVPNPNDPTYKQVCGGDTGHAEAIRVTYDPAVIGYAEILDVFMGTHDPTQLNRQGNDIGTQYRSAIFFASDEEKLSAEVKIRELNDKRAFPRPIVTSLEPLGEFYSAEDYHQDYARLNPDQPYIQSVSIPKVCKVREKHASMIRRGN
jgi:methionine-S-sulfoxide reductase